MESERCKGSGFELYDHVSDSVLVEGATCSGVDAGKVRLEPDQAIVVSLRLRHEAVEQVLV